MEPWKKEYLDLLLVPCGLFIMFVYHLFFLYKYLNYPQSTVIGYENHNKKAWVERMFQVDIKDRGPAISVISSNISAATSMSSISLVLSSLIGAWIGSSAANNMLLTSSYIYGSRSSSIGYIKYVSILTCFLIAFACFIQTARYFVHASFLISMPNNDIDVKHVVREVIRGSDHWVVGLRSLYFATNLLMWIFGPIPMFLCSVIMVSVLMNLDRNRTPLHQYQPVGNQRESSLQIKSDAN